MLLPFRIAQFLQVSSFSFAATLYTGHLTGSFYIKLTLSPDDAYLACGSADNRAYIYQVGERTQRPFVLSGHVGEVSVPRWSHHDPTCMVTLSDSAQLFVWRMFPAREYIVPEAGFLKGEMESCSSSLVIHAMLLSTESKQQIPFFFQFTTGLTEHLSKAAVTSENGAGLLAPASPCEPTSRSSTPASPSSQSTRRRRQLNIQEFLVDLPRTNETYGISGVNNTPPPLPPSVTSRRLVLLSFK